MVVPLASIQTEILLAALTGRLLPGVERPYVLADLHLVVQEGGQVFILDDQLAPGVIAMVGAGLARDPSDTKARSLLPIGLEKARKNSIPRGLAFLRFRPSEPMEDGIRLVLDTCHIRNPTAPIRMLGAFIVSYAYDPTGWHPAGPPTQLAT